MNAAEARAEARRLAGLERSRAERMADWLWKEWAELERSTVEERMDTAWRDREDAWLARLRKYERQVEKER